MPLQPIGNKQSPRFQSGEYVGLATGSASRFNWSSVERGRATVWGRRAKEVASMTGTTNFIVRLVERSAGG